MQAALAVGVEDLPTYTPWLNANTFNVSAD